MIYRINHMNMYCKNMNEGYNQLKIIKGGTSCIEYKIQYTSENKYRKMIYNKPFLSTKNLVSQETNLLTRIGWC